MDNLITAFDKIKSLYDSGKINYLIAAKDILNQERISLSNKCDVTEIENGINAFNDFFNSKLYQLIILEQDKVDYNLPVAFLESVYDKVVKLINDINEEKTTAKLRFNEDKTIAINDKIKRITFGADFFTYANPTNFILLINNKPYNAIPFNFEGQYIESLNSDNQTTIFNANVDSEIKFYSNNMTQLFFNYGVDFEIINNKIKVSDTNSYEGVFIEYDPSNSSFFIDINDYVNNISLVCDDKIIDEYSINNFFIKIRRWHFEYFKIRKTYAKVTWTN